MVAGGHGVSQFVVCPCAPTSTPNTPIWRREEHCYLFDSILDLFIYLFRSVLLTGVLQPGRSASTEKGQRLLGPNRHTHTPSREIHRCEPARALREGRQASLVFCLNHRHEFMKENMEGGWMLSVFKWKRPLKGLVVH